MKTFWVLCLVLGQLNPLARPAPPPGEPPSLDIPESLINLLSERPELAAHHRGYLQELSRRPALAESETAWWQVSSGGLRPLAARFEDALASDDTAQKLFDVYFDGLSGDPELRRAVENLVRVELDHANDDATLPGALQFLRANPDIALRFLENPRQVRPLPEPLENAYAAFEQAPAWRDALFGAFERIAQAPDAHLTVFPWWREVAQLGAANTVGDADLSSALYNHSHQYWLWHLRNLNLAGHDEIAPWIRYWNRLIQRNPDLARDYGPFISQILGNPDQLRQHLAALAERVPEVADDAWPPKTAPPKLPPLIIDAPIERVKSTIERPTIQRPTRPEISRPPRPKRPTPPSRSSATTDGTSVGESGG